MFVQGFARLAALIALIAVLTIGGVAVYQAGVAAGIAQAAIEAAGGATQIVVPYGWGGGIGFGGFLLGLVFLFLVFGLFRAVIFGGRRGGSHGRWGPWSGEWKHGSGSPMGSAMHERFETWHREIHGTEPGAPGAPAPGSEQR